MSRLKNLALALAGNRLQVVPLFLLPGVHVMEDIPTEVAIAQQALDPELKIALQPHLGTHLGLSGLLATQMVATGRQMPVLAREPSLWSQRCRLKQWQTSQAAQILYLAERGSACLLGCAAKVGITSRVSQCVISRWNATFCLLGNYRCDRSVG